MGTEYGLVKVVGVDPATPLTSGKNLQATSPLQTVDVTGEKFAKARAYQEQGYESQLKAINAVGQASSKIAAAKGQAYGHTAQQIAEIVGNITAATKVYASAVAQKNQDVEQQNKLVQKRMDDELEKQNKEGKALAQQYIRNQLLNLFETAGTSGSQEGIEATKLNVNRIINQQFASLPGEMREQLITTAYSGLEEAQKKITSRKIDDMADLKAATRDMNKAQLEYVTSALSVRLGTATTQEEQQQTWQDFWSVINENTQNLDPVDRLKIVSQVLGGAITQYQGGEKNRQRLVSEYNQVTGFYNEAQQYVEQYNKGEIGEYEYKARLGMLATKFGVPQLANNIPDIYSTTEKAAEYQRNQNAIQKMAEDQASSLSFKDSNDAWKYHIGSMVYELNMNSPDARVLLFAAKEGKTPLSPLERVAVDTYKEFSTDRQRWHQLTGKYNELSLSLAKVLDKAQPGRLGDLQYIDNLLQQLVTIKGSAPGIRPEYSPDVVKAMDTLRDSVLPEMRELREKWSAMGLNISDPRDKTGIQKLEASTSAIREEARQKSLVPPQRPVLPNF